MERTNSKKVLLVSALVILFLSQNYLQGKVAAFQYLDELFALLLIPAFLLRLAQKKVRPEMLLTKQKKQFFMLLAIFWLTGWAGYFLYHYQPLSNTAKDAYVNLKFYMSIGTSFLIFMGEDTDFDQIERKLWPLLNVLTGLLFLLCLADLIFGIWSTESRGGFPAIKLFYSAYTILVGLCVFLCAIYFRLYEQYQNKIIIPVVMLCFVMFSTRRVKSMAAIACILLVYLLVFRRRQKFSKRMKALMVAVVGVAVVGAIIQLLFYVKLGLTTARAVLTVSAPFLAWDHFPFGTGWGTYGSAFSVEPYSQVYTHYHMERVWGMSPSYHDFVSDTFWPMILGQCGFIGFAAFIGALVLFVRRVLTLRENKSAYAAAVFLLLYLLIASTSESAFANPLAVPFAFWIGFLFAEQRKGQAVSEQEMTV